jgi:SAM-dependent methyltransferase
VTNVDPQAAFTDREYHKVAPVPSTGRPSIYDCRRPQRDWYAHTFEHYIALPRAGRVLDAGCGPGAYLPAARAAAGPTTTLVGLDLAIGRLELIEPIHASRVAGDVVALPFPDAAFDVVLAMHMLYHVPHVPDAVAELHRVLDRDGVLYALTNSEHAQAELNDLYVRHGGASVHALGDARFSNESGGALLRTSFEQVELLETRDSELVVTDPECIVDEFERLRYALEPGLQPGATWAALLDGVRAEATRTINSDGAFRISENHGLFICRVGR